MTGLTVRGRGTILHPFRAPSSPRRTLPMLEQLFGSKTRVRLLRIFLHNGRNAFFVRELTRKIGAQINAVRNELDNLVDMGLVVATDAPVDTVAEKGRAVPQRKYYRINQESLLYPEMRALFVKAQLMLEKDFVRRVTNAGGVSYLALMGFFVGEENSQTDMLIVGKVQREKLQTVIRAFEREIGREVNFTVFTPQEFRYRRDVTDRFLYSILESRKLVVVDTVSEKLPAPAL